MTKKKFRKMGVFQNIAQWILSNFYHFFVFSLEPPNSLNYGGPYDTEGDSKWVILYCPSTFDQGRFIKSKAERIGRYMGMRVVYFTYPKGSLEQRCEESYFDRADVQMRKLAGHKVIVWGTDIGSGVAMYLAEKYHHMVKGVVLESPILSGSAMISYTLRHYCSYFDVDVLDNVKRAANVSRPVFIVHGGNHAIPPRHSEELSFYIKDLRYFKIVSGMPEPSVRTFMKLAHRVKRDLRIKNE